MNHTLSYDEYELLKHELYTLHNQLTEYEARLINDHVVHSIWETKYAIGRLLNDLRTQDIIL